MNAIFKKMVGYLQDSKPTKPKKKLGRPPKTIQDIDRGNS